jgi:hypothetical protein
MFLNLLPEDEAALLLALADIPRSVTALDPSIAYKLRPATLSTTC